MQPPLTAIYEALARVRDCDLRHDALLAAAAIWQRHPETPVEHLAAGGLRRARRDAWRRETHQACPVVSSDAVAATESRLPRLSADERLDDWQERRAGLSERQRTVCDLLMSGHSQSEVADHLGVHRGQVSRILTQLASA